ncbi:MAG: alpha/beta fold hydrolase [Verrucomicrobiales bacterium]|nr:alpha/beta fold hydrolase [Verrucomicrobiales bacterium]
MDEQLEIRLRFLRKANTEGMPHSDRGLLDHLLGTRQLLVEWEARPALCDAGLFHSDYGTESYELKAIPLTMRNEVQQLIGEEAGSLAWFFCMMRRETLFRNPGREGELRVQHRLTDEWLPLTKIGVALSHVIEPGIHVEKIMLTTNTPALRIFPATPGPHPIALLAHGNGGSKETLFRYGEALAAAGFDCYSVDQAGYGESPLSWNHRLNFFQELERALGEVDVFIGHSMGAARGSWSVRKAGFRPKLFIGVGFPAKLGEHGPPLLLLAGQFMPLFY